MKVLHVYKTSLLESYGGVESYIDQLCSQLNKSGIQADLFTLTGNDNEDYIEFNSYKIFKARRNFQIASTGFSFSAFLKFNKIARNYDLIHYHFPWPFMDLLHKFLVHKRPYIVTYHSDIVKQRYLRLLYAPLMKNFLRGAAIILATSPQYAGSSKILQKLQSKVQVLPLFIDLDAYPIPNSANLKKIQEQYGERFFLFVGSLRYYKGLHIAIDAVKRTKNVLVIAGVGPMGSKLAKLAEGYPNIHFVGKIDISQKVDLLSSCYGFIFPSNLRSEAFGIALLEAMLFSKPLITCEIGTGVSYVNVDQVTGIVTDTNSPTKLKEAIESFLASPERCQELGSNGRKRLQEVFCKSEHVKKLKESYMECISKY